MQRVHRSFTRPQLFSFVPAFIASPCCPGEFQFSLIVFCFFLGGGNGTGEGVGGVQGESQSPKGEYVLPRGAAEASARL